MKNILFILICTAIAQLSFPLKAGDSSDSIIRIIGLSMNYTNTQSGYGPGLDLKISIEKDNRLLGTGMFFQPKSSRVSGGEIYYKHYLSSLYSNKNDSGFEQFRSLRFFVQYDFLFRKNITLATGTTLKSVTDESIPPGGRVATFEHYLGMGAQFRFSGNLFINAGLGYGIILGSVDEKFREEPDYTMGGRKNEPGLAAKFGVGYFLKK
jgi:hypothetical protein